VPYHAVICATYGFLQRRSGGLTVVSFLKRRDMARRVSHVWLSGSLPKRISSRKGRLSRPHVMLYATWHSGPRVTSAESSIIVAQRWSPPVVLLRFAEVDPGVGDPFTGERHREVTREVELGSPVPTPVVVRVGLVVLDVRSEGPAAGRPPGSRGRWRCARGSPGIRRRVRPACRP
jgi:hypothetical protein